MDIITIFLEILYKPELWLTIEDAGEQKMKTYRSNKKLGK
jgi:hypothetical protein